MNKNIKMSYTEILKFDKDGYAEFFSCTENAFRGAMAIWDILDEKYLPEFKPKYANLLNKERRSYRTCDTEGEGIKEIWNLDTKEEVSRIDKICLRSTFDNVIVMRENLIELIEAFRNFEGNTSLSEQADEIEKEMKRDPDFLAIAWNQTSVNADAWKSDELDEEDVPIPYNIFKSKKHWSLFDDDF